MTITSEVRIIDNKLVVKGRTILTSVPEDVILTSGSESVPVDGVFLGTEFGQESSRHVVSLGKLEGVRFMACFRFKLWWMAQKMGDKGGDVPLETQFLLLETKSGSGVEDETMYVVFLPLVEGPFRACLQGNVRDEIELCLESGDLETKGSDFYRAVYVGAGTDPFRTITDAVEAVKLQLKTFRQLKEKKLPGIIDYFGWCTWDAFYQEVSQEGVENGLASLTAGATPPKFVIIDDGWQEVGGGDTDQPQSEEQQLMRLIGMKENSKFQTKDDRPLGIQNIVSIAKEKYGLKYVYVWHAIMGYWGGVKPGVEGMEQYGAVLKYPVISKGIMENDPGWKVDPLALQGIGLMDPKNVHKFYNEYHWYLASAGVDGVKVDVQSMLETLGTGLSGRVEVTKKYHQALDSSIAKNFPDNGCIDCMSHNTDSLYCSKQTAIVRASDDFFPRDPVSHTIHIAAVAYNSVFLGEFMQPDWDMFQSLHPAAEYHASARAISGGPVYVSDAPGNHNFDLLKKLVLPDGSILRARLPGRPTKDCLFFDPARDGVSLLKIWNMNKYNGVLGIYNCQGAAWNSTERKNIFHQTQSDAITGFIKGQDVHLIADVSMDDNWNGTCALYCHQSTNIYILPYNTSTPMSLKILEYDIITVTPVKMLAPGFQFAPFGLVDMYNAGGAIQGLRYEVKNGAQMSGESVENLAEAVAVVSMEVKGCGRFGAYSISKPKRCTVGSSIVDFTYDAASGLVIFSLDQLPEENQKVHIVNIEL